jgi:Uma2 family endonuclease
MHMERTAECSFMLYGVPWSTYEELDRARGERSRPRLAYLDGNLEIIMPGVDHELRKKRLARLLEAYAEETEILVTGLGSTTYRQRLKRAGLEADECYTLGEDPDLRAIPDLAIEVSASRSGVNKLEIYLRLGFKEVWMLEDERLVIYRLRGEEYRARTRSVCFPALDIADLERRVFGTGHQQKAVATYRKWLRRERGLPIHRTRHRPS